MRGLLISSHYLEELERLAERVAFLQEGRLARVVEMEQLKVEEKTIRVVFQKEPPESLLAIPGVKAVHLGRDILAFFKNLTGGEVRQYAELMTGVRNAAMDEMVDRSRQAPKRGLFGPVNTKRPINRIVLYLRI